MDFKSENTSSTKANAVRNLFETALHKTECADILERNQMETLLKEQGFQLTGCTESDCAVNIGKLLTADYVMIGSLNKMGKYTITIRLVGIKDGTLRFADEESAENEDDLKEKIDLLAARASAELSKDVAIVTDEIKLDPPKNFSASYGDYSDKIRLKWDPVKGAEIYYIFRSDTKNGNYIMVQKTGATEFSDTSVISNKGYYYKLRSGILDKIGPFGEPREGVRGKTKFGYYSRNIFLPGLGQYYYGNNTKGYIFMSGFAITGALAGICYYDYTRKQKEYDKLKFGTSQGTIDRKYNAAEKAALYSNISLGLMTAVYVIHWIDALYFNDINTKQTVASYKDKNEDNIFLKINIYNVYLPTSEKRYEAGIGIKF